ncbi:tripartite tricarboxylate transporter substrate binding protein [Falsiroseomonas sp. HW251]|uniref:tripartite tricarboxylate transporter substrate binding protein n=1 Tax=Falsiroseomonas sp. HW251 TaxID=3390998 RepID=UPI003D315E8D
MGGKGADRVATRRALLGAGVALLARPALAQTGRPVTVIVPYTPGAPPDVVGRMLAEGLSRRLGQPFVVDNRAGASGNIGSAAVSRAAPDGTTLLVQTNTLAMNASLFQNLPYDPVTGFEPVIEIGTVGFALMLHPSAGATAAEFIARARARPGQLNYGSPGIGTPHHLAMELLKQQAGIDVAHIPYRGLAGATTDLLAGEVVAMFMSAGGAAELARGGRVRLAAVASPARLPTLPDTPTLAEAGLPATDMGGWYGLFAPHGTPAALVARLNAAANEVLATPETAAALAAYGTTPVGGPPERLRDLVAADMAKWAAVVRTARIPAE